MPTTSSARCDPRGNPVSTRSSAAIDASDRALWRLMSFYGTPIDDLASAREADPAWPLPLLMQAGFLLSLTEPALLPEARALLAQAEPLMTRANARERDHLLALQTLLAGDWHGACRCWEALLLQHPRDALALQWAHRFDFYRGDAANLQQRAERVLPAWDEADPLHPFVLGLHAFGLEENHAYAQAEELGRRALAGGAKVPWAIHAVAHVMEMQGRHLEGDAWLTHWENDWADDNGFVGHLGWHHGLFALETLDHVTTLARLDRHLAPTDATVTLQRLDAAALLWRLHLLEIDVGPRWQALADGWDRSESNAGLFPFNDLHALLALIGRGDLTGATAWAATVARRAETLNGSNREVARQVGGPLMQGMLAFARGRFDDALQTLHPLRALAVRIGGSHAQRDLLDQTMLAAASRAHDAAIGRALLDERAGAKPVTPLTAHWARRLRAR